MSGKPRPRTIASREIEGTYARIREAQKVPATTLARSLPIVGFLSYYLREMPRISRWAREHGLIEFSFMRLQPRLGMDVIERLNGMVNQCILPVAPYAAKILEEGWKWRMLPIRDYNLVVTFVDFQRKIVALTQGRVFTRPDFQKMAESFYRLVYHAGQTGALIGVFTKLFSQAPGFPPHLLQDLACFFSADCMRPSLRDIILAHAMVTYRKSLTWVDLLNPDLSLSIPEGFYQCSLAIFQMIVLHVQGLERELAALRAEKEGLSWLHGQRGRERTEVPGKLARFYEDLGRSWHADSGDAFLLLLTLIGGLVVQLRELCGGTWQVMTAGEKIASLKVISDPALQADVEKIAAFQEAAGGRHQLMAPEEISLFRYREMADPTPLLLTENQKFVNGRIGMAFSGLYRLALSLRSILNGNASGYPADFYQTRMVLGKPRWRGRPLQEVFTYCIEVILESCWYFRVAELEKDLVRLSQVEKGIEKREKEKAGLDTTGFIGELLASRKER